MPLIWLQGIAFLLLPASVVMLAETIIRIPFIENILPSMPFMAVLGNLSYTYGLAPTDPTPIAAAFIGVGAFTISQKAFYEIVACDSRKRVSAACVIAYFQRVCLRIGAILGAAGVVYLFAGRYLRVDSSLALFFACGAGFFLFRRMTEHEPSIVQGASRTTPDAAEAARRR